MLLRITNILTLIASIVLLIALSVEIIYYAELQPFSEVFSDVTLVVCVIFCLDFFVLMQNDRHPLRFFVRNFMVLLLSIPYNYVASILDIEFGHSAEVILGGVVMLRAILALYITMRWLIESRVTRLLWAYITTVLVATYFAALLFYEYESPVNHNVSSFGDALWWAWMNMTTVGAEIFPITVVGKIICVLLPIIGMAMFPVFTVYVTSLYDKHSQKQR